MNVTTAIEPMAIKSPAAADFFRQHKIDHLQDIIAYKVWVEGDTLEDAISSLNPQYQELWDDMSPEEREDVLPF
jgi:hypothetical protein